MAKTRGEARAERLNEMKRLYIQQAFSDVEMADRLKVARETVFKDRGALEADYPFVEVERGRYRIDKTRLISEVKVNLNEALALYLAAQRMARQTRTAQSHVASAVEKLADVLRQPMTQRLVRSAASVLKQSPSPERARVLDQIATAWVEQRKVYIKYRALSSGRVLDHALSPYLIEPSLWGEGAYVIGHSDRLGRVGPFKVERIEEAFISGETFTIPEAFDEQALLKHAWGIWTAEGRPPDTVRLRFTGATAIRRLRETIWHPLEQERELPDGSWEWSAPVAEWREMLPWVRGWGADVEVMGPEELRNDVIEHLRGSNRTYGVVNVDANASTLPHYWLWAKADTSGNLHRLIYHMIDVGQCALMVWQQVLNTNTKQCIADRLGLDIDSAGCLIAFWASLHDLGKASPAFQDHPNLRHKNARLHQRIAEELRQVGLAFPPRPAGPHSRHEVISTWALRNGTGEMLLTRLSGLPDELANIVADMLGGHHGAFPTSSALSPTQLLPADKGDGDPAWANAREHVFAEMQRIFRPPAISAFNEDPTRDNSMLMLLAGIVSVADWLGSDETVFPLIGELMSIAAYARHSAKLAELALRKAEWHAAPPSPTFNFKRAFGFERRSDAQQEASNALKDMVLPAIAIVEAPMGSGKTEIAQEAVANWSHRAKLNGAYIAMPTTATSNQMHDRMTAFLHRHVGGEIEPLLVHSQALLRATPWRNDPDEAGEDANDTIEEHKHDGDLTAAQAWFLPRRKSLLAPYGVGTVDQALMSVLQTKHFFVRLLGLSNKVVVFDEVHAYDAYMSVLFERLLTWLGQLGTSVVILSATLPNATRERFIKAYVGQVAVPTARYPRLTAASLGGQPKAIELTPPKSKTLAYVWMARDEQAIVEALRAQLANGGCAAVICNTISRAQRVYRAIKDAKLIDPARDDESLILFHARFPMAWREGIEYAVLDRFGPNRDKENPNPARPRKAIVVATQVIEQSLDLDFDVMITDHAPADLLLQRAGRLHRHQVNDTKRAHPYRLTIAAPEVADGLPKFDRADKLVYDEYILLRSWLVLCGRAASTITIPDDLSEVVEQVYGDLPPESADAALKVALDRAQAISQLDEGQERFKAKQRLIPLPHGDVLHAENLELEEDNPLVHKTFQALTRSDKPGINVVCLHRLNGALYFDPAGKSEAIDPTRKPNKDTARESARHAVVIRRPDLEALLLAPPADEDAKRLLARWKKVAALRYHRVLIFGGDVCVLPGASISLVLSREYGLEIVRG